jgi:hypothetical protein
LGDMGQPAWGVWLSCLEQGAPPEEVIERALHWLLEATAARLAILFLPESQGEQVEFAYVAGAHADELRGFRLRPHDALIAPALLQRTIWQYHAETYQDPIGTIATGIAVPLPSLPVSALALLNRDAPFEDAHLALLMHLVPTLELLVRLQCTQTHLEQRERALRWLSRLPKRLGADLSLQHALETIESLMRKVAPEGGGVWLYDENRRTLLLATQYGAQSLPEQIALDMLPSEWAHTPLETVWSARRYRAYPLTLAEQPLGWLALALPADAPDTLEWLPPLLGHISLTLSHALLYEQTAQRAHHMAKLYDLSLQLGETRSLREVLRLLCQTTHELIPHEHTVVYLPSRREPERLMPIYVEPPAEVLRTHYPDAQYSLPGWVFAFNAPIAAPDLPQHPQNLKEPLPGGFASALAAPLQVAERTLGTILLLTTAPREFTLSEVELLFTLANTGALRLHTLERAYA